MSNSNMIRKQLYVTREQERALKDRAREEGQTEAEIVREALDRHLRYESSPVIPEHRRNALEELITLNEEVARHHRFPRGYTTLRRLRPSLPEDQVYRFAEKYQQAFRVLPLTPAIVLEAVRGVRDHQLGYYDAQIWAARPPQPGALRSEPVLQHGCRAQRCHLP